MSLCAQNIWNGPKMTFTKIDGVDWTIPSNQDRITDNVHITRQDSRGIFNIKTESSYTKNSSPSDTEWAFGTTADIGSLTFNSWELTHGSDARGLVNRDMVLHLISDDIYIDIKFLSFSDRRSGGLGGFSYERSTESLLSVDNFNKKEKLSLYPNPATNFIRIRGLSEDNTLFTIYNVVGVKVLSGYTSRNSKINIQNLDEGAYLLATNKNVLKFIKVLN